MVDLHVLPGENAEKYLWRIGQAKDSDELALGWNEISKLMNEKFIDDEIDYKGSSAWRKDYRTTKKFFDAGVFDNSDKDKELKDKKLELEKERKKLQTEKIEYNRWIREDARDEMILESICNAMKTLPSISRPRPIFIPHNLSQEKEYLLCIADAHYGVEFTLPDLLGNNINAYSPEIFENRMWKLLDEVISIIRKEDISHLNVWELGDGIEGILRLTSQLMKLRYGIIDSSLRYANFLADWLLELSKYVKISFQMVKDSNHCQLRICNAKKNAFPEENMSKVVLAFLKERLKDVDRITISENPTGFTFDNFCGSYTLGNHGEMKNFASSVNDFERLYNQQVDYVICGHIHHFKAEEVGKNSEVIACRSIMGGDPYGASLNRVSNAGASLFVFENGKGKTCEYTIKLD